MDFKYIKLNILEPSGEIHTKYINIDKITVYDLTGSIIVDLGGDYISYRLTTESDDKFRKFLNEKVGVFK